MRQFQQVPHSQTSLQSSLPPIKQHDFLINTRKIEEKRFVLPDCVPPKGNIKMILFQKNRYCLAFQRELPLQHTQRQVTLSGFM